MEDLIYIAIVALLAGLIKGIGGFGSSLVTIPLLLYVFEIEAIVIMMITFSVLLNAMLLFENKGFKKKNIENISLLLIFGIIGTGIGVVLLTALSGAHITIIAAILLLVAAVMQSYKLLVKNPLILKDTKVFQGAIGLISGVGNGIASVDGPPVIFYLVSTGADKVRFKNTAAPHFLIMSVAGVVLHFIAGNYTLDIIKYTGYMAIFAAIGLVVGMIISKRLNERHFQIAVVIILFGLATKMLFF
ncbi:sulfite exporter TauE/SafE family protein [Candidatus Izimaplasma bacterium]|nr:sulfite exporter TauE/SafE family protein [Candidatus Izimaplasma bacterium]